MLFNRLVEKYALDPAIFVGKGSEEARQFQTLNIESRLPNVYEECIRIVTTSSELIKYLTRMNELHRTELIDSIYTELGLQQNGILELTEDDGKVLIITRVAPINENVVTLHIARRG